jgi:hypothetical protein
VPVTICKITILIHSQSIFSSAVNTKVSSIRLCSNKLKRLHLTNYFLFPHPNFSDFKHLKTILLEELKVQKDILLCLFTNFYLENFTFIDRRFRNTIDMISSTLHHLKLITSRLPTEITISAPNLSSFDYRGNILSISSIDAPQL